MPEGLASPPRQRSRALATSASTSSGSVARATNPSATMASSSSLRSGPTSPSARATAV